MLPLCAIAVVAFASTEMVEIEKNVVSGTNQMMSVVKDNFAKSVGDDEKEVIVTDLAVLNKMNSVTSVADTVKARKAVFDVAEVAPEFPGGISELVKYLYGNVRYPKESMENNEQGRVIVKFIVAADGTVENPNIVKSVSPLLDAEALRVVSAMPKWIPGQNKGENVAVSFVIPISFNLEANAKPNDNCNAVKLNKLALGSKLIVINGKKLADTSYKSCDDIDPADIESVTVLKEGDAIEKYGAEGKDGVVEINLKAK